MVVPTVHGPVFARASARCPAVVALAGLALLLFSSLAPTPAVPLAPPAHVSAVGEVALAPSPRSTPTGRASTEISPAFSAATDGWLLFQGDVMRDGVSPDPTQPTTNLAWEVGLPHSADGSTPVTAGLVTNGNLLYVASDDDLVYALNQTSGAVEWTFTTSGPLEATPAVHQGLLLVGSTDGNLYELNASTGTKVSTIPLGGPDNTSSPLPIGDNVVVPCKARNICEFDLATGAQVWNQTVGAFSSSPAYDPTTNDVLVSTQTGILWCLSSTGGKLWGYNGGGGNAFAASPIVGSVSGISQRLVFGLLTTPSGTGELLAFNETTMTFGAHPLYITYFSGGPSSSGILTASELVVPTLVGTVQGFDPTSGASLTPWDPTPWVGNANPISASVIDAQGTLLVAMPGSGLNGQGGGELAELNGNTGQEVATLAPIPASQPVESTPAIDSAAVFFADDTGNIYAIGPSLPSTPQHFSAVAGNESIALSWQAPSSSGGVPLAQYEIKYVSTVAGVTTTHFLNLSASTTSDVLTGLANGVTFSLDVAATNAEGAGPFASATATTGAVPYPPQQVADRVSQNSFEVLWQPPSSLDDGGFPVLNYTVQYWTNVSGPSHTKNATGLTGTSWTDSPVPDGVAVFAEVAAINAEGPSEFTSVVSGTPYYANGVLSLVILPSSAWASVQVTLSGPAGSPTVPLVRANGTARMSLTPGVYWVNASASGFQIYDEQESIGSGSILTVYLNLTKASTSPFQLSFLEYALLIGGLGAVLLVGLFVLGMRYRRLEEASRGGEEEEEEGPPAEGYSEEQAQKLLQRPSVAPQMSVAEPASPEEGEELDYTSGVSKPPEPPEEEDDGTPEGAAGRLGEYLSRRRNAKETLKSPEEDTPDAHDGPSEQS